MLSSKYCRRNRTCKQDSAYSWLILAACFFILLIIIGFQYTYGLILPDLLEEFDSSRASTGWIGSLGLAFNFLMGPVAGYFCRRFSCCTTAIIGSVLSFIGLLSTSFVKHLPVMYLTYSIVFGTGSAFCYSAAYNSVPKFFKKWRSVSVGILASGAQIGTLCMSPLVNALLSSHGWVITYQILAGMTLLVCILSLTFRNAVVEADEKVDNSEKLLACGDNSQTACGDAHSNGLLDCGDAQNNRPIVCGDAPSNSQTMHGDAHSNSLVVCGDAQNNCPTPCSDAYSNNQTTHGDAHSHNQTIHVDTHSNSAHTNNLSTYADANSINLKICADAESDDSSKCSNVESSDLSSSGYAQSQHYSLSGDAYKNLKDENKSDIKQINHGLDFSVWRNSGFSIFTIATTISMLGFYVPTVYLGSHCKDLGISEKKASQLYMIIAIASVCGRLISGVVCDILEVVKPLHVAQFSFLIAGLSIALIPVAESFETLVSVTIFYGMFTGAIRVQFSLVLLDYIGLDKMSQAWGFLTFTHSIAIASGVPLAGLFSDQLGSYTRSFYLAGGIIIFGGMLITLIYCTFPLVSNKTKIELDVPQCFALEHLPSPVQMVSAV